MSDKREDGCGMEKLSSLAAKLSGLCFSKQALPAARGVRKSLDKIDS